jgi:CheY-like chemotaxis protein
MEHLLRKSKHLLCIDDYETALAGWCLYLQEQGYCVTGASSPQEGLEIFATQQVDAVVLDYSMPELTGDIVAGFMKKMKPEVPIIIFTGLCDIPEDLRNNIDAFLEKGSEPGALLRLLDQMLQTHTRAVS